MSTNPITISTQSPECLGTENLGADKSNGSMLGQILAAICKQCKEPIPVGTRKDAKYCSRECQHPATKHIARDMQRDLERELHTIGRNIAFRHFNRDRYLSFDGKYEGPLNKCDTTVEVLKKDHGYHPMPRNVHVRAIEPKFNNVTPDDEQWAKGSHLSGCDGLPCVCGRSRHNFQHTHSMPRRSKVFCATCTDAVVDDSKKEVRVTKGVYLPIEHECSKLRVYDLTGRLLEVLSL